MVTPGGVPHEGGKIIAGCQTVLIEGESAAAIGDVCLCNGGFLDVITSGSSGVFIEGKPAARQGDLCSHGGMITSGSATVLIGETMNPDLIKALIEDKDKSDFIELSEEEKSVLINQAIQDCIALLERKFGLLEQKDQETLDAFQNWFGSVDDLCKEVIKDRIKRQLVFFKNLTLENFDRIPYEKGYRNRFAHVYPSDISCIIYLGNPFWNNKAVEKYSRTTVLIHESSHFIFIGNTKDFAYEEECDLLGKSKPDRALYNADSYAFFITC
jgi:uncharacterized Zn-binding protein involved in type VI secretion